MLLARHFNRSWILASACQASNPNICRFPVSDELNVSIPAVSVRFDNPGPGVPRIQAVEFYWNAAALMNDLIQERHPYFLWHLGHRSLGPSGLTVNLEGTQRPGHGTAPLERPQAIAALACAANRISVMGSSPRVLTATIYEVRGHETTSIGLLTLVPNHNGISITDRQHVSPRPRALQQTGSDTMVNDRKQLRDTATTNATINLRSRPANFRVTHSRRSPYISGRDIWSLIITSLLQIAAAPRSLDTLLVRTVMFRGVYPSKITFANPEGDTTLSSRILLWILDDLADLYYVQDFSSGVQCNYWLGVRMIGVVSVS